METQIMFYFFLCFNLFLIYCHKCGTDLLKITPGIIRTTNITNKRKLYDFSSPIKIKVDMTNLKSLKGEKYDSLDKIFSEIINSFSSLISINYRIMPQGNEDYIKQFKNNCGITNFEESLKDDPYKDYDLLIFPILDSLDKNVLAAATPCIFSDKNLRPMAGIVKINKDLSLSKKDFKYYMKNLLFHEITHVLGFHPIIFDQKGLYYKETIDNEERIFINSPKVLEKAKIHFGCDSIEGIRLENQGGEGTTGSHWESRYMLGDYMISSDYQEVVISDITLALLEDTGFYKINYYTGGLFRFGKNQGCAFLDKKCLYNNGGSTSFPNEFCLESGLAFCTSSHLDKGDCYLTTYKNNLVDKYRYFKDRKIGGFVAADYCPVSFILETNNYFFYPKNCNYGKSEYSAETLGSNSICFESSIFNNDKESVCYKMSCGQNKIINVYIKNTVITCPGYDTILSNPNQLKGEIHCPDYNLVCTSSIWCNEMFDCINKKSTANLNSYDYISNKEALKERDKKNLNVNDNVNKGDILRFKIKYLLYILFLLFI